MLKTIPFPNSNYVKTNIHTLKELTWLLKQEKLLKKTDVFKKLEITNFIQASKTEKVTKIIEKLEKMQKLNSKNINLLVWQYSSNSLNCKNHDVFINSRYRFVTTNNRKLCRNSQ